VVTANAWMNTPTGFRLIDGRISEVDPFAAMFQPRRGRPGGAHAVGGICGGGRCGRGDSMLRLLLRDPVNAFHRRAFVIALAVGLPAALLSTLSGDWAGRVVARTQPAKLAALEAQFETTAYAPLRIGGIPNVEARETRYALEIPGGLSFLAHGDPAAPVTGLNDIPRE